MMYSLDKVLSLFNHCIRLIIYEATAINLWLTKNE